MSSEEEENVLCMFSHSDYSRTMKMIERDEKNRVTSRVKLNSKAKNNPIHTIKIDIFNSLICLPFLITFEEQWNITVKCLSCGENHTHNCGNNQLPKLGIKEAPCGAKYEIFLNEKWIMMINNIYQNIKK